MEHLGPQKAQLSERLKLQHEQALGEVETLAKAVLNELKIDYGPGYRVYYTFKGKTLILLLCGGDKSSQSKDIRLATEIAASWET